MNIKLKRFLDAQKEDYQTALNEIKSGKKRSHWMWYIFPQVAGLGFSETSKYYAINDIEEAKEYLNHEILGSRLKQISNELLKLKENNAKEIFGSPDHFKLKSSMTLFVCADRETKIFQKVLDKYFQGSLDNRTIEILEGS